MKKLILIYLVLLTAVVAIGQRFPPGALVSSKRAASGSSCSTLHTNLLVASDPARILPNTTWEYWSHQFTASKTATVCGMSNELQRIGSPSGTIVAAIYTDSANAPGTQVGSDSSSITMSSVSTSANTLYWFSGLNASLTAGTVYHVVIKSSSAQDASNYIQWNGQFTGSAGRTMVSHDLSSWGEWYSGATSFGFATFE